MITQKECQWGATENTKNINELAAEILINDGLEENIFHIIRTVPASMKENIFHWRKRDYGRSEIPFISQSVPAEFEPAPIAFRLLRALPSLVRFDVPVRSEDVLRIPFRFNFGEPLESIPKRRLDALGTVVLRFEMVQSTRTT